MGFTIQSDEIISATELCRQSSNILKKLRSGAVSRYVVMKDNKLSAVLISPERAQQMQPEYDEADFWLSASLSSEDLWDDEVDHVWDNV